MPEPTIYDEATDVDAEDGIVVDVRMKPDAAEETSERLNTGAMRARGHRYFDSQS